MKVAPNYYTTILHYYTTPLHYEAWRSASWLIVAPGLGEDTSPSPTPAFPGAWRAPAQPGAQPWLLGDLARRQRARPRPPSKRRCSRFQAGVLTSAATLLVSLLYYYTTVLLHYCRTSNRAPSRTKDKLPIKHGQTPALTNQTQALSNHSRALSNQTRVLSTRRSTLACAAFPGRPVHTSARSPRAPTGRAGSQLKVAPIRHGHFPITCA